MTALAVRNGTRMSNDQVDQIRAAYRRLGTTRKVSRELGVSNDTVAKYTRDIEFAQPIVSSDLSWQEKARCLGYSTETFFPRGADSEAIREAKAICRDCSVVEACLAYAERTRSVGIWGGRAIGLVDGEHRKVR